MEYVVCTIRPQDWKEGGSQSLQTSRVCQNVIAAVLLLLLELLLR